MQEFTDAALTLTLLKPVAVDGEQIYSLTLGELNVDQLVHLEKASGARGPVEADKYYFAAMCGRPPEAIGALTERDWKRLKQLYWNTLGNVDVEPESSEP